MKKVLSSLNNISSYFESIGQNEYAQDVHNVFMKLATNNRLGMHFLKHQN